MTIEKNLYKSKGSNKTKSNFNTENKRRITAGEKNAKRGAPTKTKAGIKKEKNRQKIEKQKQKNLDQKRIKALQAKAKRARIKHRRKEMQSRFKREFGSDVTGILSLLSFLVKDRFHGIKKQILGFKDKREPSCCNYSMYEIVIAGILMQLLHLESRNRYNQYIKSKFFRSHIYQWLGINIPHGDTIHRVIRELDDGCIENLLVTMARILMEKRFFCRNKLLGTYKIVIDGTGIGTITNDSIWMVEKISKSGLLWKDRSFLRAQLVGPYGMRIDLMWEPIERQDGRTKEDCEINAAKRLFDRLKEAFPKTKMTIIADALYAAESVIIMILDKRWNFIFTFKSSRTPALFDQFMEKLEITRETGGTEGWICDNQSIEKSESREEIIYRYLEWNNNLIYRELAFSGIICVESVKPFELLNDEEVMDIPRFAYLTNLRIRSIYALEIEKSGRERAVIEDSFNHSKNRGAHIKHKFSRTSTTASKNYLTLTMISEMLEELMVQCDWFISTYELDKAEATRKDIWDQLRSWLRYSPPVDDISEIIEFTPQQLEYAFAA